MLRFLAENNDTEFFFVDSIPDFQKNALADMALEITRACFEIPGMEERYQQWLPGYLERKRQREAEGRR